MKPDGHCKKCGHHYSYHYHNEVIFIEEECEEELIDPEMKAHFEKSTIMEERAKVLKKQLQKRIEESQKEKERLSKDLLLVLDEFHAVGMNRNYAKVLQTQIEIIDLRLRDVDELETAPLQETKVELEKKLELVQKTLKEEPWSETHVQITRVWACSCLKLDSKKLLTGTEINKAFKEVSKTFHPDKGGDSEHFQRVQQAKDFLLGQLFCRPHTVKEMY